MFSTNAPFTQTVQNFMHRVYGWMTAGLLITAGTSYAMLANPQLLVHILTNQALLYGLFIAQLAIVIYLSARIAKMSYTTAAIAFCSYAALLGVTLTPVFLVYTMSSIVLTFTITSGMFGSMALYGYYTNTDLSGLGNILLMGLWGIILASLANWYFVSAQLDYLISYAGVVIFTLLTAYDVQKIKMFAQQSVYADDYEAIELSKKISIMGALTLYLDFVNLFLHLLRVMGKKRR